MPSTLRLRPASLPQHPVFGGQKLPTTSVCHPLPCGGRGGIEGYLRVMSELETATSTETITEPTLDDGDHDRFAHFARKADITKSAVTGRPIVALCGKVWVPGRNPDRYPVCPTCKEIYQRKKAGETGG